MYLFYVNTHTIISLHCALSLWYVVLFARCSTGTVVIRNLNVVRPDSIVTDVLVLNKRQSISGHRVDRLYREFRVIWIILHHIDTVGSGLDMFQESGKDACAICLSGVNTKSSFCVACFSWVLKRCNVISGTRMHDPYLGVNDVLDWADL